MATWTGTYAAPADLQTDTLNPAFVAGEMPDVTGGYDAPVETHAPYVSTQPVNENANALQGHHARGYAFLHWYNRLHVTPLVLALGNLISSQQRSLSVFNGYLVPRTLIDVEQTGDEAITIDEPRTTAFVMAPLEELEYLVSVAAEGAPTVAGSILFLFDIETIEVVVSGVRVVAWQWEPNWINPVVERLAWLTDVLQSYDGHEQRRQLRGAPRQSWSFTFDALDRDRRRLDNLLQGWGGRIWALPVWPDLIELTEPLAAGSTEIPADTAGRAFVAGGLAVILHGGAVEAIEIDTVEADRLVLAREIVASWPPSARLFPAITARLERHPAMARYTWNHIRATAELQSVEEIAGTALTEEFYRDLPVMIDRANWREEPSLAYLRKLVKLAFEVGRDAVTDEAEMGLPVHSFLWSVSSRAEAEELRAWLYARRGRAKSAWLPTFAADLVLVDTVAPSQLTIDLEECGLANFAEGENLRRDVRIELTDGTVYHRRLASFVTVDAETERATMNSTFGRTVEPADVLRISWMHLVRLDHDAVEISWATPSVADCGIVMKGARHDG